MNRKELEEQVWAAINDLKNLTDQSVVITVPSAAGTDGNARALDILRYGPIVPFFKRQHPFSDQRCLDKKAVYVFGFLTRIRDDEVYRQEFFDKAYEFESRGILPASKVLTTC
ncbi:hypothetical protein FWF48_02305 [Candidatus Saccharibacteria bacterium]|nr:hypothetical protein [Candidatus Saccharibacteria bacterium]